MKQRPPAEVMNKGQCVTKYYRWIQKNGGYIWIQSSATIAVNAKNSNEKNIIWVNYVLSNPEYKDTPIDIVQLPNLPEKTSESSESSDSESESKENSDNEKSEGKSGQQAEHGEESDSKRQQQPGQSHCSSEQEMKRHEEGDSSSNPESQDSDDSLEPSDGEQEQDVTRGGGGGGGGRLGRLAGLGGLEGLGTISGLGSLGGLHIKVEHYGEGEELQLHNSQTSSEEEEEDEEDEEDEEEGGGVQDCDGANAGSKLQKRRKRRKVQKWDGLRSRRLRLSTAPPSPSAAEDATPPVDPSEATPIASTHLLTSSGSPSSTGATSSVLKIKTEMAEPINFDNDSSIWNYPPNREISRNESPYSMTSKPPASGGHETFPSPQGGSLHVVIPDSVLTPPGTEGGAGGVRKPPYNGSSAPSSSSSTTSLAPPSNTSSADPLSPPLSASPRDKQQGTPTTSSSSSSTSSSSSSTSSSSSLLYSGDLEALQRLQAGNVVLPLVHRVTGTLAPSSTTAPRVYTTGTIRYAPADVTLAMAQGNLLPNAAMNFVDSSGFGLDPKTPMEMLYHHVHRLNMTAAAAAGPFVGSTAPAGGNGALGGQMPAATNVFTTAEGLFSTLPFPVYSNGIHTTQTALERKED